MIYFLKNFKIANNLFLMGLIGNLPISDKLFFLINSKKCTAVPSKWYKRYTVPSKWYGTLFHLQNGTIITAQEEKNEQ